MKVDFKKGDKIIVIEYTGTLNGQTGNVFTFSNWCKPDYFGKVNYLQVEEIHWPSHSLPIESFELFDPSIHKEYRIMTQEFIHNREIEFQKTYGPI